MRPLLGYNNTSPISHDIYIMTRSVGSDRAWPWRVAATLEPPPSSFCPSASRPLSDTPFNGILNRNPSSATLVTIHSRCFCFFFFLFSPPFALSDFDWTFKTRDVTRPLSGPGERIGGRRASRDPIGGMNLVNPFQTLRLSVVLLVLLRDPRVYYRKIFLLEFLFREKKIIIFICSNFFSILFSNNETTFRLI